MGPTVHVRPMCLERPTWPIDLARPMGPLGHMCPMGHIGTKAHVAHKCVMPIGAACEHIAASAKWTASLYIGEAGM